MFSVPDLAEVVAVAKKLGIHLSADEAELYREYLVRDLDAMDAFVQSREEVQRPPLVSPQRGPGYRPGPDEDPLNVWAWKCRIEGAPDGLLASKTVSFKDHIAVAGIPMSAGSFALEGFIPDFDATVVTRVLQAGGTVVGKNTMGGLSGGVGSGGGVGDYGRPLNPHNRAHLTGGSSSGSGAAIAGGEVDIAFGGDQGGSIRLPAAMSGAVGLKPTFGLVSHFGVGYGFDQSIDFIGPMARTVEEVAAALQATAGPDGYDPRQGRDVPLMMDVMSTLDAGLGGLRIGVVEEGFDNAHDDVTTLVMDAVDVLAKGGAEVSKVSIPQFHATRDAQMALMPEGARALFDTGFYGSSSKTYYPASLLAAMYRFHALQTDLLAPRSKLNLITAEFSRRIYHGRVYAQAQNVRPTYVQVFDAVFAEHDVVVMPTCVIKAPKYEAPVERLAAIEGSLNMFASVTSQNTMPFNYTGHPALAVPVGKSEGLPVSMQLVGRFFEDPLLLRVAHAYEHAVDWEAVIRIRE